MAWYIRVTSRAATSYEDLSSHYFIIKHIIKNLLLTDVTGFIKPYTGSLWHTKRLFIFKKEWYKYLTVKNPITNHQLQVRPNLRLLSLLLCKPIYKWNFTTKNLCSTLLPRKYGQWHLPFIYYCIYGHHHHWTLVHIRELLHLPFYWNSMPNHLKLIISITILVQW